MSNLLSSRTNTGPSTWMASAAAQSAYAAGAGVSPAMITSTADARLNGSIRQMFLLTRRYRPPCTHTTTR